MVLDVGRLRFGAVGAIEDFRLLARLIQAEWLHVQHEVTGTAGLRLRLQGTRAGRRWLLAPWRPKRLMDLSAAEDGWGVLAAGRHMAAMGTVAADVHARRYNGA